MKDRPKRRHHKRTNKRWIIPLIIVFLISSFLAWWFIVRNTSDNSSTPSTKQQQSDTDEDDPHPNRIRLIAGGDIVLHDSVNANAKQSDGTYDYYSMMDNLKPIFDSADIKFCNQVTPAGGTELGITGYPEFNAPTQVIDDLSKLGCNLVNMASNHSFDNSQDAITNNVTAWEKQQDILAAAGQNRNKSEKNTVHVFNHKGVKFAFLAYTTYINGNAPATNDYGVNTYSRDFAQNQIAQAKDKGAEVIIISMRWGDEYSQTINSSQRQEAQFLANQGVSLILGHGPHVLQPAEQLNGPDNTTTLVWYSLGNFLNTQLEAEALFNGLAVVDYDTATKKITSYGYLPVYMHYEWSSADAANENLLARKNLDLYLLENTTSQLLSSQQSKTTIEAQMKRIQDTLSSSIDMTILTKDQYDNYL